MQRWIVPRLANEKAHWREAIKGGMRSLAHLGKRPKAAMKASHVQEAVLKMGDCEETNALCLQKLWLCLALWSVERRSELRYAKWRDLTFVDEGVHISIPQSKGDQLGAGQAIALQHRDDSDDKDLCPVCQLIRWRTRCEEENGGEKLDQHSFVLRRVDAVTDEITEDSLSYYQMTRIVKAAGELAGLDPKTVGCHSTRRGGLQTHADRGTSASVLMELSRHTSLQAISPYLKQSSQAFSHGF